MKQQRLRKVILILLFFVVCVSSVCAADDDYGLNGKIGELLKLLGSPWVKGIACIALIVEAIALITAGRQEPGMFKKFIPWIAGTIIFMAAGTITTKFINVEKETFESQIMDKTTN